MTTINVQFTDATDAAIRAYFAVAPTFADLANIGTVEDSDPRWAAFYDLFASMGAQGDMPVPAA